MKIKTKKQMTLPQLIEWAWDNDVKDTYFVGNGVGEVEITPMGFFKTHIIVAHNETFTVEVEEEVTEETVISKLVETYLDSKGEPSCYSYRNKSINYVLNINECYKNQPTKAFYILNDDLTMTLIWKDGEMVE